MNLANVRYYCLLGDNSRFCFQAFALEQQATNGWGEKPWVQS